MSGLTIILILGIAAVSGNVVPHTRPAFLSVQTASIRSVKIPSVRVNGLSLSTSTSSTLMGQSASGQQILIVTINQPPVTVCLGSRVWVTFVCLNVQRTPTVLMATSAMTATGVYLVDPSVPLTASVFRVYVTYPCPTPPANGAIQMDAYQVAHLMTTALSLPLSVEEVVELMSAAVIWTLIAPRDTFVTAIAMCVLKTLVVLEMI